MATHTASGTTTASGTKAAGTTSKRAAPRAKSAARKATSATKNATRSAVATTKSAGGATASAAKKAGRTSKVAPSKVAPRKSSKAAPRKATAAGGRAAAGADAIAVLKSDHREVEALFARFESLGNTAHATRESTVAKVIEALSVHAAIEETVFYPAVRNRLDDSDPILEALEEHHLVKLTLAELQKMGSKDERYSAKMTVLKENVEHHVEEEESDLFGKVRTLFTRSELADLGDRLREAKTSVPTRPHPSSPDTPPGNVVASALTAPLDAAAHLATRAVDAVRDLVT